MDQATRNRINEITIIGTVAEDGSNAHGGPEFKVAGMLQQLPLSEIQTLAEQSRSSAPATANSLKRIPKIRTRKTGMNPNISKDKRKSIPAQTRPGTVASVSTPTSSQSSLVSEALALATSKGLRGGYIEFMRSNTDESIKRSFEEVKKELTNRQSFLKSSNSVVRYLQAARILYNRLDLRRKRKYEIVARNHARFEHRAEMLKKGVLDEMPLFINGSEQLEGQKESIMTNACAMPPSECIFATPRSSEDIARYEALESRKIICPLCPVDSDKITNTAHYQGHMLEHHSCAHFYACHFCGVVFLSLEALKTHDGCVDFTTALVQRISPSGDVELQMKNAFMLMVCADCGSQLLISSTYIGESSILHWDEIVKFHMLHNLEKIVPLVIYSEVELSQKLRLRIQTMTSIVKDIEVVCPHCGESGFDSVASLESHFETHEESNKKRCPECSMQFSQEAFFREHLLSHLGTKACYLAIYLSNICTFITKGVSCCGPNAMVGGGAVVYGGVSSAIFNAKMSTPYVDAWESVTTKKKSNRRGRKRRAGPTYKKDPDEIEAEVLPADDGSAKLRKVLGDSFDHAGALRINSFFYTAIKSEDETAESSKRCNGENAYVYVRGAGEPETSSKLADDISQKFTKYCRLAGGKPLSKKHNPCHSGIYSKVLMCQRCHCLCIGDTAMLDHLSRCCPELRNSSGDSPPYDLDDSLLVFCVFPGFIVPNSRISCWECSATLCSVFGLRVHMAAYHGVLLKVEEANDGASLDSFKRKSTLFSATTRAINLAIGLTEDGNLPVNLEEKRKEALLAKLKSCETPPVSSPATSSSCSPVAAGTPAAKQQGLPVRRVESPPIVILDSSPPHVMDYGEPPSVQVIDSGNQNSPNVVQRLPAGLPAQPIEEFGRQMQIESHASLLRGDMVSIAEADLIDEIDGLVESSSVTCSDEVNNPIASSSLKNSSRASSANGVIHELADGDLATASGSGESTREEPKEPLQCEFCCLTMRTYADLELHLKWHTEMPLACNLCDPPLKGLERLELLLEHVKAQHTIPIDSSKQDGNLYVVCAFCNFQVRKNHLMAHLVSDCYMAPCPLCGDKLIRRNDRVNHRKAHKNVSERFVCECRRGYATITAFREHICRGKAVPIVSCTCCTAKFVGSPIGQGKAMKEAVLHFIAKHTKDLYCFPCKNEPLEALSEHAQSHLTEGNETCAPKPFLHTCSEMGLLYNSIEFPSFTHKHKKGKKTSSGGARRDQTDTAEATEATESSSSSRLSTTLEETYGDGEASQQAAWERDDFHQSESSNSRDGNSPSLLEKQRQVLAELIDDLGPPPSVIVLENGTAEVREEREETPSAVPKSSVVDDSDDEIVIVDAMKEPAQQVQARISSSSTASPVVHLVNEGDDECMMLDVLELPTGATSQSVSTQREKKYKCSMCSETFLRQSTCHYHEQTSHRNDIISDLCDEVYGIPLMPESVMYLCQQCAAAFEDQQKAHRHRAQHMVKGPAFPCEKCSSICLTDSNLREHHKKHDDGKLSYRCLKCSPNRIFTSESAIFFHLYTEHSIPFIAFCKNCLLGSANLDRIFSHVVYRECSGSRITNPRISMITIQRSLGFAVASDLYFQPTDEEKHKKAEGLYAVPSLCSHRSFITFGDSFTTCPEEPSRCAALVNQNRWHSHLCATNKENPGEMPTNIPEGLLTRNVGADNMIDMLISRFKFKERNRTLPPVCPAPSSSSSSVEVTAVSSPSQAHIEQRRQSTTASTCEVVNRRRVGIVEPATDLPAGGASIPTAPQQMFPGGSANEMPVHRQGMGNGPPHLGANQAACLLCRTRNVPMICEPTDRAYDAVNSLCTKFREVHPGAAQSLFSTLNAFIRDNSARGRVLFCFCRWHYPAQCFDPAGRPLLNMVPSQINSQVLLDNYHNGMLYPDPASVALLTPAPVPPSPSASRPAVPAPSNSVAQPVVQRCVVCDLLSPSGPCKATSFYVDYMVAVPVNPVTLKEQWAMNICRYLTNPIAQDILNGFRLCHQPRLCLRHFNPRTVTMGPSGALVRSPSCGNDMPILDFAQYAALNTEFNQALSKLLDGMEKCQNSNTIAMMLRIVQDLVKCSDERCGRPLNSSNDVRLHRFHQLQSKFVCMECFSTAEIIRTEQEMIEHFALKHSQRNREGGENKIQVVYTLHCPLRNCNGAFPSVQMLRKHINHIHSSQFPMSSDNCATRFVSAAKMTFHNGVHEKHSCDVTCCYLCGVADPWQRELAGGMKISHELVHAMKRFVACKTCMAPMGQDPTGAVLIDHFMRQHMLDQPRRVRHCKVCRQNVIEPGIAEHILEQHRLVAFRPRYAPQSNMVSVMNGSELCVYLGLPSELCKSNPLADSSELG